MSDDIIARLRGFDTLKLDAWAICDDADEITRLRADLAAAREALTFIRDRVKRINFLAGLDEPIREQAAMAVDAIDAALKGDASE